MHMASDITTNERSSFQLYDTKHVLLECKQRNQNGGQVDLDCFSHEYFDRI